ncbi:MAG: sugar transferase [Eubacteriales bacterium]|nr:sugar transferase [Eubacteriales bacterium]
MRVDRKNKTFISVQGAIDLLIVYLSYYLAVFPFNFSHPNQISVNDFILLIPFIMVIAFIFFQIFNVFDYGEYSYVDTIIAIGLSGLLTNIAVVVIAFGLNQTGVPSKLFIFSYIIQMIIFGIYKYFVDRIYQVILKAKQVVIVGCESDTSRVWSKINNISHKGFDVMADIHELNEDAMAVIQKAEAIFIMDDVSEDDKLRLLKFGIEADKDIYVIPNAFEIAVNQSRFSLVDDMPVFFIRNCRLAPEQRFMKRMFDVFVSILMILLTSPFMLVAAIGTKLHDKGPVFYRQERITKGGRAFGLIKFRTMVVDAEKHSGPVLATDKDDRITGFGAFLRMTRIDELPQLFNVLRGDMSIVGPRPERQFFIDEISRELPDFRQRLTVKAGITGLAQVSGKYSTQPVDKLKFDLMYITNYSMILDIRILLQTLKVVFSKESHK